MIKIFYCNSTDQSTPIDVSEQRLCKINSAKREKQAMINAACVLKAGFASYGIRESEVIYSHGEHGKPFAMNFPHIHFSLAHSHNLAIVAFYDNEIGVDCEKTDKKISAEIIKRYFSPTEQAKFANAPLLLWVAKEALVKQSGKGLAIGRGEYEIPYFTDEVTSGDRWLKRLSIDGYECVLCAIAPDEIEIQKI